jgi:GWxTD domain-containing protein
MRMIKILNNCQNVRLNMSCRICSLFLPLLLLPAVTVFSAQNESLMIHHDIAVYAAKDNLSIGRADVYVEILYDDLQFVKADSGYRAEYELSAVIYQGKDQIDGKIWKQAVVVDTYERTNSRNEIDLSHASFDLAPGDYKSTISIEDLAGSKIASVDEKFKVEDFARNGFSASNITFARIIEMQDGKIQKIFPEVTNPYKGLTSPSFAYFEVYTTQGDEKAEINYKIIGENAKTVINKNLILPLQGERTGMTLSLPVDSLQHDSYRLEVEITNTHKTVRLKKTFYIRWPGLPRNAKDLNTAIQQLQFIATQPEWKKLKKASPEQRREAFTQFWSRRDPSPGTEYNETMEAYYQRVNTANELYSVIGREGWRTDRGLVYIILGQPDEVIRNDYPSDSKPYQIWQYYSINRQFQFYDRNGFGDYELLNPISIYEIQRYAQN